MHCHQLESPRLWFTCSLDSAKVAFESNMETWATADILPYKGLLVLSLSSPNNQGMLDK